MDALISVIIPTHGGCDFLLRAIDSVRAQTYPHREILVVDDNGAGSALQRKTEALLQPLIADSTVRYLVHAENRGGSAARNTGAVQAKGEFLAFLDDDDEYFPDFLSLHMRAWKSQDKRYAMTYCGHELCRSGVLLYPEYAKKSGNRLYEVLCHTIPLCSTSLVMRSDVFREVGGFDESFRRHQDWEMTARVAAHYPIFAVRAVGFRRNLEFRNSPRDPALVRRYRLYYLEKMKPCLELLSPRRRRRVVRFHQMDIAMQYLKAGGLSAFFRTWREFRIGPYGLSYLAWVLWLRVHRKLKKLFYCKKRK